MFSTTDTIVAIATPTGRGALGIVRLSGPDSPTIALRLLGRKSVLEPRLATFGCLTTGTLQDQVVVTFFPSPRSYTGDDVVEICSHGSDVVLREILRAAVEGGARLAAPGEFTLRAYVNGRVDLVQAEAVADLIEAATPLQARAAFDQLNGTLTSAVTAIEKQVFELTAELEASVDFPDEGYHFVDPSAVAERLRALIGELDHLLNSAARGRLIREGARVVLTGLPNAGKSRLFNALVGSHRAIVSSTPGTTRDLLTEVIDLAGLKVTLVDTAGLSDSSEPVEQEGVSRAMRAAADADLVLHVVDGSVSPGDELFRRISVPVVKVSTKHDLPPAWSDPEFLPVSAETGTGLEALEQRIAVALCGEDKTKDTPAVSNLRHLEALRRSRDAMISALQAVESSEAALSEEFVLVDLQAAAGFLQDVTGRRATDELLVHVFSRFCIGK